VDFEVIGELTATEATGFFRPSRRASFSGCREPLTGERR
jgi:hypothetical protein